MAANTPSYGPNAGGFLPPTLPSPAPSTASSRAAAGLPHPRSKPLPPGSRKEDYAREYVSQRLLHISRRYVKKHGIPDPADLVAAYATFDQVCKDLDEVVDVLWFSGTPSLQVPYLLNVALAITEYLPSFPPSPRPTFALLNKLDHCFASLLAGKDVRTNARLPGFENGLGKGLTKTDMVRLKSLADETRVQIALKMSSEADVDTAMFPEDLSEKAPSQPSAKRKVDDVEDEDQDLDQWSSLPRRHKSETPDRGIERSADFKRESRSNSPALMSVVSHDAKDPLSHNTGQFHWAVEDDDLDEDEISDGDHIMADRQEVTPPPTSTDLPEERPPDAENIWRRDEDIDGEDEELYMSVAKVYEKAITLLGRTLGESLIDE